VQEAEERLAEEVVVDRAGGGERFRFRSPEEDQVG